MERSTADTKERSLVQSPCRVVTSGTHDSQSRSPPQAWNEFKLLSQTLLTAVKSYLHYHNFPVENASNASYQKLVVFFNMIDNNNYDQPFAEGGSSLIHTPLGYIQIIHLFQKFI